LYSFLNVYQLCMIVNITILILIESYAGENITRILDRLLDGYDNWLRPGSGGRPSIYSFSIFL
uniref:Neurotransmitter-gated ion-channel ligand-binding domain-containing protein n=1 Tax=Hucho hucho TaxID=62062 RepID=A0A4W5JX06_9TELE